MRDAHVSESCSMHHMQVRRRECAATEPEAHQAIGGEVEALEVRQKLDALWHACQTMLFQHQRPGTTRTIHSVSAKHSRRRLPDRDGEVTWGSEAGAVEQGVGFLDAAECRSGLNMAHWSRSTLERVLPCILVSRKARNTSSTVSHGDCESPASFGLVLSCHGEALGNKCLLREVRLVSCCKAVTNGRQCFSSLKPTCLCQSRTWHSGRRHCEPNATEPHAWVGGMAVPGVPLQVERLKLDALCERRGVEHVVVGERFLETKEIGDVIVAQAQADHLGDKVGASSQDVIPVSEKVVAVQIK
eukprot:575673-Rhodomonas_salina.2